MYRQLGTDLRPLMKQETRWTSTYKMIKRYFELSPIIKQCLDWSSEVSIYIPTFEDDTKLAALMKKLSNVQSAFDRLQSIDNPPTLKWVRFAFDRLIEQQPSFATYLAADAAIVQSPRFENALVKIASGKIAVLSAEELQAVYHLRDVHGTDKASAPVENAKKKARTFAEECDEGIAGVSVSVDNSAAAVDQPKWLMDLDTVPATTVDVERLFSQAKIVLEDRRSSLLPKHVEELLFLRFNRSWWNLSVMNACYAKSKPPTASIVTLL